MSETVKSFNDKIEEIKEDREKFDILMDEFFGSADMNIKELLAEMMFHIIMTRGAELQEKFDEIDKMRKMFEDTDFGDLGITPNPGAYQVWPSSPGTVTNPLIGPWIVSDNTTWDPQWLSTDTFKVNTDGLGLDNNQQNSSFQVGSGGNVTFTNTMSNTISEDDEPVIIPSIFTHNTISDVKIQNIIDKYERVADREYSDDSFKSAISAISSINWSASSTE